MALSIDYMLQNGYNLVVIFTKHKYPSELKVWMEIVTDGTRTDLVQFTHIVYVFKVQSWYFSLFQTALRQS